MELSASHRGCGLRLTRRRPAPGHIEPTKSRRRAVFAATQADRSNTVQLLKNRTISSRVEEGFGRMDRREGRRGDGGRWGAKPGRRPTALRTLERFGTSGGCGRCEGLREWLRVQVYQVSPDRKPRTGGAVRHNFRVISEFMIAAETKGEETQFFAMRYWRVFTSGGEISLPPILLGYVLDS